MLVLPSLMITSVAFKLQYHIIALVSQGCRRWLPYPGSWIVGELCKSASRDRRGYARPSIPQCVTSHPRAPRYCGRYGGSWTADSLTFERRLPFSRYVTGIRSLAVCLRRVPPFLRVLSYCHIHIYTHLYCTLCTKVTSTLRPNYVSS